MSDQRRQGGPRDPPGNQGAIGNHEDMTHVSAIMGIVAFTLMAVCVNIGAESGQPEGAFEMHEFLEFGALRRPSSPNHWLVAPPDADASLHPDAAAPSFQLPAERLARAWVGIVEQGPRTRIIGISDDGLQVEAEQRSAWFGFVDKVSFHAVTLDQESSTFFAYSRSQTGYWDFGVNRQRLSGWVEALRKISDGL